MSAQQSLSTITSGHQGPAGSASEPASELCLFSFVPCCLLIMVCSTKTTLFLVGIAFFLSFPWTYNFVFVLSSHLFSPPHCVAVISFPAALFRCQKECISASFVSLLAPPASAHMFAIRPYCCVPPAAPDHIALSALLPCLFRFCAALTCHSFWLLSKHHLLPGRRQQQNLFAIQILFFFIPRRLSPAACVAYSQYKWSCKWLYT